jgi:hypothetical protein
MDKNPSSRKKTLPWPNKQPQPVDAITEDQ